MIAQNDEWVFVDSNEFTSILFVQINMIHYQIKRFFHWLQIVLFEVAKDCPIVAHIAVVGFMTTNVSCIIIFFSKFVTFILKTSSFIIDSVQRDKEFLL